METPRVLEELSKASFEAMARRRAEAPEGALVERIERWRHRGGCFAKALRQGDLSVIAEYKPRSPSAGRLGEFEPEEIAERYRAASAISVLTEEESFGGSLEYLERLRGRTDLPLLCKDFITHPYQLVEAKAAGADAVLLITGLLDEYELQSMREHAADLGLDALVEVHDRAELDRALTSGARIVGINNRDLAAEGHPIDTATTGKLLDGIPDSIIVASESGLELDAKSRQKLRKLNARGLDAVLIGTELMRADDPAPRIEHLRRFGLSRRKSRPPAR
ncbi:MAG: indole-3-glycerol phosphate synthase TrpC [bacterium]|nr:indole-3-glycerol phosphate synthase TrpC [bacterium]